MSFSRLTANAGIILMRAQDEARLCNYDCVGVEHLLLALIAKGDCLAGKVFNQSGITIENAREKLRAIAPATGTEKALAQVTLSESLLSTVNRSHLLADELFHDWTDSGHILQAILEQQEGPAHRVLQSLDADAQALRTATISIRNQSSTEN